MTRAGIDFEVPGDYAHISRSDLTKKSYFVVVEMKLLSNRILRKRVMVLALPNQ